MEAINERFLDLLRTALVGGRADADPAMTTEDWQRLFRLADIHKVTPMIYETVCRDPGLQQLPEAARAKALTRHQVILQTLRTSEFLELNRLLRASGVTPLVVKGLICRELYPRPDHRPSGDEDVLIPPEQFELCHRILTEFGMEAQSQTQSYEISYRKPGSPLHIELHKHLFPPESRAYGELNRFFQGVFDRAITEAIRDEDVCTMGYTDHLFYLICHAFKHFLHSGFGIRQVCDILLYARHYGDRVDWEQVLENSRAIRADKFAAAIFRIGQARLGFDPDAARWPESWRSIPVEADGLLEDILRSGLYGDAVMSRRHSSSITLDAVSARNQGRQPRSALTAALFPSAEKLEGRYPWLKKYPWLLPAAWWDRWVEYAKETAVTTDNSAAEAMRIGTDRVSLLRQYGILE